MKIKGLIIGILMLLTTVTADAADLPMDLITYIDAAAVSKNRCASSGSVQALQVTQYLNFALENDLITGEAYDWGKENGFYPVVGVFRDRVVAVCQLSATETDLAKHMEMAERRRICQMSDIETPW